MLAYCRLRHIGRANAAAVGQGLPWYRNRVRGSLPGGHGWTRRVSGCWFHGGTVGTSTHLAAPSASVPHSASARGTISVQARTISVPSSARARFSSGIAGWRDRIAWPLLISDSATRGKLQFKGSGLGLASWVRSVKKSPLRPRGRRGSGEVEGCDRSRCATADAGVHRRSRSRFSGGWYYQFRKAAHFRPPRCPIVNPRVAIDPDVGLFRWRVDGAGMLASVRNPLRRPSRWPLAILDLRSACLRAGTTGRVAHGQAGAGIRIVVRSARSRSSWRGTAALARWLWPICSTSR